MLASVSLENKSRHNQRGRGCGEIGGFTLQRHFTRGFKGGCVFERPPRGGLAPGFRSISSYSGVGDHAHNPNNEKRFDRIAFA